MPGFAYEHDYRGHIGLVDDTAEERLGEGTITHDTRINNPGGLAGVWAEERSRDAIFEALQRREVFGTSGPRIPVRLFGGWGYDGEMCADPDRVAAGYDDGVPMGGELGAAPDGQAPRFAVWADADPDAQGLQRIQIVKGWVDSEGVVHEQVFDVAGGAAGGLDLDEADRPEACASGELRTSVQERAWSSPIWYLP